MEINVNIDHASEDHRRAAAQIFDLALARPTGPESYATLFGDVIGPIAGEQDEQERVRGFANLVDGAVTVVFSLLTFAADELKIDPADLSLEVERGIQRVARRDLDEE